VETIAETIKSLVHDMEQQNRKFDKGNKAAGRRTRKYLMEIIVLSKQLRKQIVEETKERNK